MAEPEGEHRPLTIMFVDLVGSTDLSMTLDPEDLREVLQRYQDACSAVVADHEGMVANLIGDGILAYFGYPVALEDASSRAADAALQIVTEVERIDREMAPRHRRRIRVRVALHAGMVLVGEMGTGQAKDRHAVVGALPNVAARLQELAPSNGVVISEQVRRRLGEAFAVTPRGRQRLKGVAEEVAVYELGPRRAGSGEALPRDGATLFGRESELGILARAWEAYLATRVGGIVTVSGDPGVGKTRLLRGFLQSLRMPGDAPLIFTGGIASRGTPFKSLWQMLERHCGTADAEQDIRDASILDWFAAHGCGADGFRESFLALRRSALSGPEGGSGSHDLRADVFAAFRRFLAARPRPLLMVLEDAHWIDPSTLETIDAATAEQAEPDHLMLVMTRSGKRYPWTRRVTADLELSGLTDAACRRIIQRVADGVPPDRDLVAQIASLANGLPLHVEEMARMLIERNLVSGEGGRLRFRQVGAEIPIPGNLMDLLMARLDALGDAKSLAQAAAVLGPVVSAAALEAVTGRDAPAVRTGLSRLVAAMVLEEGRGGAEFRFRHALFQKAAYETLLRRRRAMLHGAYVDWLASRTGARAAAPETLGYHCFGAGRFDDAMRHYRDAGLLAARTGANREAAACFRRAREALRMARPDAPDSVEALELQVRLAGALMGAEGTGADGTAEAYETAVEMCGRVAESRWHFPAYWGWWRIATNFPEMTRRAARICAAAERVEDPEFKLQAHHCMWANTFQIGAHNETLHHAKQGLALYHPETSAEQSILFGGHDCKVCGHGQMALTRWLMGAGEAAAGDMELGIHHGEALGHEASLLHALDFSLTLQGYLRDGSRMAPTVRRILSLGETANMQEYVAKGEFYAGWIRYSEGDVADGLAAMRNAYAFLERVATNEDFPLFLSMSAAALRRLGDLDGAAEALAQARRIIATEGVTYWAAEIEREEAETAMARPGRDDAAVAALLATGRRIAREQGALGLELRNAQSSARWLERLGDPAGARAALEDVLGRLAPGARGRDVEDARRMAERLGS